MYEIDALTVNAYLGLDGIEPFLNIGSAAGKAALSWCAPPMSLRRRFSDLALSDGRKRCTKRWRLRSGIRADCCRRACRLRRGAVCRWKPLLELSGGRTPPPDAEDADPGARLRCAEATGRDVAVNFDSSGMGAIVNASRSLMCAWRKNRAARRRILPAPAAAPPNGCRRI